QCEESLQGLGATPGSEMKESPDLAAESADRQQAGAERMVDSALELLDREAARQVDDRPSGSHARDAVDVADVAVRDEAAAMDNHARDARLPSERDGDLDVRTLEAGKPPQPRGGAMGDPRQIAHDERCAERVLLPAPRDARRGVEAMAATRPLPT